MTTSCVSRPPGSVTEMTTAVTAGTRGTAVSSQSDRSKQKFSRSMRRHLSVANQIEVNRDFQDQ